MYRIIDNFKDSIYNCAVTISSITKNRDLKFFICQYVKDINKTAFLSFYYQYCALICVYRSINMLIHMKKIEFYLFRSRLYRDHSHWKLRNCDKDNQNIWRKCATRKLHVNKEMQIG